MRRLLAVFFGWNNFFLRNRFTTTNLSSVRMATNVTNANMAVIQNIDDAVRRRDYSWLESNADLLHQHCSNPNMWKCDISPFISALNLNDIKILKLVFQPFVSFNTYNKMESEDRMRLAPAFIKAQTYDSKARVHTMLLFMNAIISLDLNEITFWCENGDLFNQLANSPDYTLGNHPMRFALAKNNKEVFEYLLHSGKCTIPELATNATKLRLLIKLLLRGSFECADVLWTVVDPNERLPLQRLPHEATVTNPIGASIIHQICFREDLDSGVKRAEGIKWLLEKGLTDYDAEWSISEKYPYSLCNPAFVAACYINDAAAAKVLLEHDTEKWKNNAGAVLEILPIWRFNRYLKTNSTLGSEEQQKNEQEISKLFVMLVPLLNPDTKTADLANAQAASILYEHKFLETELKALGADLQYLSKKDEYHFGKGRHFTERLKLFNLSGELLLPIEDEDDEFIVDRIEVNTRTTNVSNIKKKMKNVNPNSEIYFNAKNDMTIPQNSPIKVWDRLTGRIYKDSPFIRSLFVGDLSYTRGFQFDDKSNKNTYKDRYSLFVEYSDGSWVNGYKIMYKPVTFPSARLTEPNSTIVNENNQEENVNTEPEAPRRSGRSAKRKNEPEEQPASKRRRIAKK